VIFRVYVDLPEGMRYGFGFANLSQTEPFQQLSTISPFQWRVIFPSDAAIGTCQQQRLFMRGQRQPEVTLQALHPIERGSKNPGAGGGFLKDDTTAKTTTARTRTTTKTTTKTTKTMTTRTTTEPEPWVLASKANGRGLANHFRELKWALRKCHFWSFNVQKPADLATYPIISVIIYYDHPLYSCIILHTW